MKYSILAQWSVEDQCHVVIAPEWEATAGAKGLPSWRLRGTPGFDVRPEGAIGWAITG
jgi:hypothetical protein